jgi:uncharacterized caspase-like protein
VLLLDTCHAAGAIENGSRRGLARLDINSVINEFASAENGVVAFASSTGREDSVENDAWQNGAFTKALGLRAGWADLLRTGTITLTRLDAFVVSRVKELTSGVTSQTYSYNRDDAHRPHT